MSKSDDDRMANMDWDAVLTTPSIVQHLVKEDGSTLGWLDDLRQQRKVERAQYHRVKQLQPEDLTPWFQPRDRAPDCSNWIKKHNAYDGGIRKRKPNTYRPRNMARAPTLAQYQRHSIHLMMRVLNLRTNASPFTLVLDDLNQRAMPLVGELVRRGLSRNVNIVIVAFETTRFHPAVRHIPAYGDSTGDQILQGIEDAMKGFKESLVIVDSLHDLVKVKNVDMGAVFHLVAVKYASTLIGIYHQDMLPAQDVDQPYAPHPLDVFKYMATCVMTCKSFAHVLAAKAAKERSLPEPTHGLLQGAEGVVQCLNANDHRGIVLEAEFRRKSGRPESETYFLRNARPTDYNEPLPGMPFGTLKQEFVVLLDQVPTYASPEVIALVNSTEGEVASTFNLGLTEKQKEAREGVVLPYFDAQNPEGGEGGRILYDMGSEDDFDEEEDEI